MKLHDAAVPAKHVMPSVPGYVMNVLETGNGSGSGVPDPEAGRILRRDQNGRRQVIADGLTFPTAMAFGPDGRLYVSNLGYEVPSDGTGEIVVIEVRHEPGS